MFVEKIKTEGLAHLSWLIGDGTEAAVIDPRRDCAVYAEMAHRRGCRITHIFETHRNEDLVSGAPDLAAITGARVHHGPDDKLDVTYAETVREGDHFTFGGLTLCVMETPGHTDDSLSFAIYDKAFGENAVGVFTGDTLFVGDVGRTDFYPDRARNVAGDLFDSLQKICALGDQAIIYPAHGAGSVCGNNMADRDFNTIGYERQTNPMLRMNDRDAFIDTKLIEHHDQPPYFRLMEEINLEGGPRLEEPTVPPAFGPKAWQDAAGDATILDVRGVAAYLGAHLPGAIALPDDMIPAFAGWFLDPLDAILLVANDADQASCASRHLARIGFDGVKGFLTPSITGWAAMSGAFQSMPVVDVPEVARRLDEAPDDWTLLDVRGKDELAEERIDGAQHIYVGEIAEKMRELDPQRRYTVMCKSGARSTIAASMLRRQDFKQVDVFMGSMSAWKAAGYPVHS
ncbi:rhodanese-like domain-containing protein [Parvibaculum sp.]|uniref:MBL fold metallo-hydrolase n=1 Tax=Parvibaculum sp. TaxID=2024848 RepID=UPI000C93F602|nr:rhodanese-like domain-containing protein [Parvibaculum sp.]MAB13256.1 MBL fold metallo-hydrolase [Parvibaculum sp.]